MVSTSKNDPSGASLQHRRSLVAGFFLKRKRLNTFSRSALLFLKSQSCFSGAGDLPRVSDQELKSQGVMTFEPFGEFIRLPFIICDKWF